jgi:hypothetical protein
VDSIPFPTLLFWLKLSRSLAATSSYLGIGIASEAKRQCPPYRDNFACIATLFRKPAGKIPSNHGQTMVFPFYFSLDKNGEVALGSSVGIVVGVSPGGLAFISRLTKI